MSTIIFVIGWPGSGKTTFSKQWIEFAHSMGDDSWKMVDKDEVAKDWIEKRMESSGVMMDLEDRDSPEYQALFRDLEYKKTIEVIRDEIKSGRNVIAPAPWSREVKSQWIWNPDLELKDVNLKSFGVIVHADKEQVKRRIQNRRAARDAWKIQHWEDFSKRLIETPEWCDPRWWHVGQSGQEWFNDIERVWKLWNQQKKSN